MSIIRALLRSTYFRVALFVGFLFALASHPTSREYYDAYYNSYVDDTVFHDITPQDPHYGDRKVILGSKLFSDLEDAKSQEARDTAAAAICEAHYFEPWKQPERRVYDLVMISNELDWLEVRLHTLSPYVDYFVIVEAATTFTGLQKELVLQNNWSRFKDFHHKIIYKVVEDNAPFIKDKQWDHEHFLRNAMLTHVFPDLVGTEKAASKGDVLIVSDLDEIIRPETAMILRHCSFPPRLRMRSRFFYYAYQWAHRNGDWDHPQATTFGGTVENTLEPEALRKDNWDSRRQGWKSWDSYNPAKKLTRAGKLKIIGQESAQLADAGWHCSSCFRRIQQVIDKLNGFSHVEFNSEENRKPATIINRYQHGLDLFGRPEEVFAFDKVEVDDVPEYVMQQYNTTGRFGYLLDRTGPNAQFEDAEALLQETAA